MLFLRNFLQTPVNFALLNLNILISIFFQTTFIAAWRLLILMSVIALRSSAGQMSIEHFRLGYDSRLTHLFQLFTGITKIRRYIADPNSRHSCLVSCKLCNERQSLKKHITYRVNLRLCTTQPELVRFNEHF